MKSKITRGKGFRGSLNYILGQDKKAEIVGGNMDGQNPKDLATEFSVAKRLRPDIQKPVYHVSLSLPSGEKLSSEKWEKVCTAYLARMGLDPSVHQWVAARHQDNDHDHVHIIASRVGLDSSVYVGKRDVFKSIDVCQGLEKDFGLIQTPGKSRKGKGKRPRVGHKEQQMNRREGRESEKVLCKQKIDSVLTGEKMSVKAFCLRLESEGVYAIPNVASTGRMNGFSFAVEGRHIKGRDVGWVWKDLAEKLEPLTASDIDFLQTRKKELGQTTKFDALKCVRNAVWESVVRGVEWETAIQNQGWELRDGEIQKNGIGYKMDDLVDTEKLNQGLLYLQNVSTQARARAREQAREQAKKKSLPSTSFFKHQRPEDILFAAVLFPQFFVFMLALNLAIVVLSQNQKAETKNIYKETNAYISKEIKKIQDEVVIKNGDTTTRSNPASVSYFGTEGEGNREGDAGLGRSPNQEVPRGPDPDRGPGVAPEKTEVPHLEGTGVAGNGSGAGDDSVSGDFGKSHSPENNPKADLGAIKEWANILSDLQLLGGDKMEKKEASKTVQYIQNQWDIQSNALGASHYRITLRSRKEGSNAAWNLGKGKGKNEEERFWTAEEVRDMVPKLASYNARKNEIYITPVDDRYHFLLIDDVKPEAIKEIQKEYTVCECHSSSRNNVQVVIKIDRDQTRPHAQEQSIANEVLKALNFRWGDKGLTGVRRPFRCCGFRNKKAGKNDFQTKIILAQGEKCPAARDDYFRVAEKKGSAIAQDIISQTALAIDFKELAKTNRATTAVGLEFCREWKKNAGLAKSKGWEIDESVIDFRATLALLKRGYKKEEIGAAILQFSPALCARHKNAEQYVAITLQNAEKKLGRGSRDMERGMERGL